MLLNIIGLTTLDTSTSKYFLQTKTKPTCTKVTPLKSTVASATAADGGKMTATHKVKIPLAKELSTQAQTRFILNNLLIGSLVSIGQLCDDDYIALFTKCNVKIIKNGTVIIEGRQDHTNGLWKIPLQQPSLQANNIT